AVIRQAEAKLPRGKALLDLAQCYDLVGKTERAKELYEAAFAAHPDDAAVLRDMAVLCLRSNRLADARSHLDKIMRLKTSPPAAVSWARRTLALVQASGGDYQKSQAALALLGVGQEEAAAAPAGESVEDLRAKVVILAAQPSVRKRQRAIGILEGLRRQQVATADEQFLLARLYESVGAWRKTRNQ